MSILAKKSLFPVLIANGILVCLPFYAYTMPSDGFLPSCDIRQLDLSSDQHEKLRDIRLEHKNILRKAENQHKNLERSRRQNIARLLSASTFDESQATRLVSDYYQNKERFAVEELSIQHKIYRLLNAEQQKTWLKTCLR